MWGRIGCIHSHRQQCGRAGCINLHFLQSSRAGYIPVFRQQSDVQCRVYPSDSVDVQGVFLPTTCSVYVLGAPSPRAAVQTLVRVYPFFPLFSFVQFFERPESGQSGTELKILPMPEAVQYRYGGPVRYWMLQYRTEMPYSEMSMRVASASLPMPTSANSMSLAMPD
jgi:hypothetical protein